MAVCASLVDIASPRSTNDTAALRDVNFFSRFSIEMFWDTDAMKARLPGRQTIVQPILDLRLYEVSRQLITIFSDQGSKLAEPARSVGAGESGKCAAAGVASAAASFGDGGATVRESIGKRSGC